MKKIILGLVVVLVLAVVAIGVGGYLIYGNLDTIAKEVIERGGKYALGEDTTVETVELSPFNGQLKFSGLNIDNPEGFEKHDQFLQIGDADFQVDTGTILSDLIVVDHATIDGLRINFEANGTTPNFQPILDHLQTLAGGGEEGEVPAETDTQDSRRYVIKEVTVNGIELAVVMDSLTGDPAERVIKLPPFELTDIGTVEDGGVTMAEAQAMITQAGMAYITQAAGKALPQMFTASLAQGLSEIGNVGNFAFNALGGSVEFVKNVNFDDIPLFDGELPDVFGSMGVENVGESLSNIGGQVSESLGNLTEGLGEGLGNVGEGLGNVGEGVGEGLGNIGEGVGGLLNRNRGDEPEPSE